MGNYHHKWVRVSYHYFLVMDNGLFPSIPEGRRAICTLYRSDLQGVDIRVQALDGMKTKTMVWYSEDDYDNDQQRYYPRSMEEEGGSNLVGENPEMIGNTGRLFLTFGLCIFHVVQGSL